MLLMKNILYIGNQLSREDKTVTTIETLSKLLKLEGYTVYTVSKKSNKVLRLLDMLNSIVNYRKKVDYVLIDTYSTQNFFYAYLCSQLCRLYKLKYIPILHGGNLPNRLKNNPKLSKAIFNNAYKNISPSEYLKSVFEGLGYSNIACIPNVIELKGYVFKKRVFDKPKLLWVRSFSEIYNPLLAIKILKALQREGLGASLCMVGPDKDGSMKNAKKMANNLNVQVSFTGKLSKDEWSKLSEDYNIFINTTNFDNMPVSVLEAMALGLPIISTDVGGMPFLIENEDDGMLVEPNNVEAFVKVIKRFNSEHEFVNKIISKARQKAESYDWNVVKNEWFKVLS